MSIAKRTIDQDVLAVLAAATIANGIVRLNGQLDRSLYVRTNQALEALGGKWDRHKKGHVFAAGIDPVAVMGSAIDDGEYVDPRLNGYFPTPDELAQEVIRLADIQPHMDVLEPSAGRGALALLAAAIVHPLNVDCCELMDDNREVLRGHGFPIIARDFLELAPCQNYERVVMNPPFAKGADIKHVAHALKFLKPGGRLVAIMSPALTFRTDKQTEALKQTIAGAEYSEIHHNPANSFASVGTGVNTITLVVQLPEAEAIAA